MKDVSYQNFHATKVALSKTGGLEAHYHVSSEEERALNEFSMICSDPPRPVLLEQFRKLSEFVADIYDMTRMTDLVGGIEFNPAEGQEDYADRIKGEIIDSIRITKVHISGEEGKRSVVMYGTKRTRTGAVIAINTERIKIESENQLYGWEHDLLGIVNTITAEAYRYIFEDERAQLEIFEIGAAANA